MEAIYDWVRNIIIFLVLTTIIGNLLGKSSYKKYITLTTGIILVILVVSPLLQLFHLDETLDYYLSNNLFKAEAEEYNGRLLDVEETKMTTIVQNYKDIINEQVEGLLKTQGLSITNIDIVVEENEESKDFGSLKSLTIEASMKKEEDKSEKTMIEDILIDKIKIGDKEESEADKGDQNLSPEEINVKNLLSDFYNMNPDNINISIQEQ